MRENGIQAEMPISEAFSGKAKQVGSGVLKGLAEATGGFINDVIPEELKPLCQSVNKSQQPIVVREDRKLEDVRRELRMLDSISEPKQATVQPPIVGVQPLR